jgi:hypothetical protein
MKRSELCMHHGTTRPTSPLVGDTYCNPLTGQIMVWNGGAWLTVAPAIPADRTIRVTEVSGFWKVYLPDGYDDLAIGDWLVAENIRFLNYGREFIFHTMDDAVLLKLKFQEANIARVAA